MSLTQLRKVEDGYDVLAPSGEVLGYTYRAPDQAWSYAAWVIDGVHETVRGGVGGSTKRRKGWPTRAAAVREIEVMNSAALMRQAC